MNIEGLIEVCLDNLLISCHVTPTKEEPIGFEDTFLGTKNGVYLMYPSVIDFMNYIRRYRGKRHGVFSGDAPRDLNLINSLIYLPDFYTIKGEENELKHYLRHISMNKYRLACFVAFALLEKLVVKFIIFLDESLIDENGVAKKGIDIPDFEIGKGKRLGGLNKKIDLLIKTDNSELSKQVKFLKDHKVIERIVSIHRNNLMHTGKVLEWEVFNILHLIYLLFLHDKSSPFDDYITKEYL